MRDNIVVGWGRVYLRSLWRAYEGGLMGTEKRMGEREERRMEWKEVVVEVWVVEKRG